MKGKQCCGSGSGILCLLTPESGMGRKLGSGSEIRIRDKQPGSYFRELRNNFFGVKILKFSYADPGWKILDLGSGNRDKHPGSATLMKGSL
jgi:hypothetical protein